MKRSWHFTFSVILIVAALATGCGSQKPAASTQTPNPPATLPPPTQPAPSGTLTAVSRSVRLDPATVEDAESLTLSSYVYDSLTGLDATGNPQPALALNWTISNDQLDYILVLRQGVTFHSGAPFNADAVLTNFNRWFDPADALHGSLTYSGWTKFFLGFKGDVDTNGVPKGLFDGIEKVDEHTVLIHLNRPEPKLLANLAQPYFAIADPTLLASKGTAYGTSADAVSGTGAYLLSAWNDSGLLFKPNAKYWGSIPSGDLQISWK
jgi:peptide/nickel transport system substrate-binding protein